MNEEQIIVQAVELEKSVDVGLFEENVETTETVAQIDVIQPEEMVIDVEEVTGIVTSISESADHTHQIEQIVNLENRLITLGTTHEAYSPYGGYAEFRKWKPLAQNAEVGRFVGLVYQNKTDNITSGNTFIEVCDGNTDVYGVTVGKSAFCGYQDPTYCLLEPTDNDNSTDTLNCAKVCLLGVVSVRQGASYDGAKVGDYVVSDKYGCAIRSENGVGFRVVGVGQYSGASDSYWNYKYVDIALVPQNDNVARVMAELEGTKQNLGNLSIQIGKLEDDINNSITSIIPDMEEVLEDVNGAVSDTQSKLDAAANALDSAQKISGEAKDAIDLANTNYAKAVSDMEAAKTSANNALAGVSKIEEDMTILKQHEDKIVSFFDEANEDEASLAIMVKQTGDIAVIKAKTDKNGAALEHLVAHADRYCVGEHSLSYDLSYEEALGILGKTGKEERNGYIYVPTVKHDEKETVYSWGNEFVTFEAGKTYVWMYDADGPNDTCHRWQESSIKVSLGNEPTTKVDGDLWYTWNGVRVDNVWQYEPETLYRWIAYDDGDGDWIAVARANDGNARTMSFINQTAKEISSTVTNLEGNVSEVSQTVNNISSTVSEIDGDLTRINQTAEAITLGAYSPNKGMSSLEILLNGMRGVSSYSEHVLVGEFGGEPSPSITKYRTAPVWTDNGFSFAKATEATEETMPTYYFDYIMDEGGNYVVDQDGKPVPKTTYYCKQIDKDIYEIYTIGNQAMANISTRVDNNKSAIESWTLFESEFGETMTQISQESTNDVSELIAMVLGQYKHRVDIQDKITEAEKQVVGARYDEVPIWNKKFVFTENQTPADNGLYCIPTDSGGKYYWKLLLDNENNIIGYEKYEMKASNYASLMQKTNEDGSVAGLVVGNDKVEGGIFVDAINDGSTSATIHANKIAINGTTTFADALNPEQTAISGNYIKTGVITSNNYNGPVTYKMYGAKIGPDEEGNAIITTGELAECLYYTPIVEGDFLCTEADYVKCYAAKIEPGVRLFKDRQTEGENESKYIVCDKDFDLQGKNIETLGTKFDLNNGTIYSKNLSLDRAGNLSITGKITADSGLIGGFTIADKYLYNAQETLEGIINTNGTRNSGVYLGIDGIGLGNGNFYVDNLGNLTTNGGITLNNTDGDITSTIQLKDGNISLITKKTDGNKTTTSGVILENGNIELTGNITWPKINDIEEDVEDALNGVDDVENDIIALAEGEYTKAGATFISGKNIYSPNIYANEFSVYPEDETVGTFSGFILNGYYNVDTTKEIVPLLKIYNKTPDVPSVAFTSYKQGTAYWEFGNTEITGTMSFSSGSKLLFENGATVEGLTATFG